MRAASLLLGLLVLGVGPSVAPNAAAEAIPLPTDVPYCLTPDCEPLVCAERTREVTADTTTVVTTHSDCTIDLETGKGVVCVGAWSATEERDVGPIHWTRHYCNMPGGPLDGLSSAGASAQGPPQCTSVEPGCCGIEPSFAPCCSILACPPPVARCPDLDVDTTDFLLFLGPSAGAETDADCSANACMDSSDCSDAPCRTGAHPCCSIAGTGSYCTNLCALTALCAGTACPAFAVSTTHFLAYLGPHASVATGDCQVDVQERGLRCAIGTGEVERTVGPATVGADVCMPPLG